LSIDLKFKVRRIVMSNKEYAIQLLEKVPDYKIDYVIAYIQGLNADEEIDDEFCEKMYQDYLASDPVDKETVSFEEVVKARGVNV
jgi:abortive infection bacteriophage resistance protein